VSSNARASTHLQAKAAGLALLAAAFALLAFASFAQAQTVVSGFGDNQFDARTFGGHLDTPRGVAVNASGNGALAGTSYVVDAQARIQRFSPSGNFQRAWGQDVTATTVNEQQHLEVTGDGTFTLTFNGATTTPIPAPGNSSGCKGSSAIDDALDVLPSIGGDANVNVTSYGCTLAGKNFYTVTFTGALAAADQPQLTADAGGLTALSDGPPSLAISTLANGANSATTGGAGTGFEICTVADYCKAGSTSDTTANGGQLSGPQGVAVNQANGNVYVTESGNRRVSEFDADGNFIRAWGWDVDATTPGTGFEVCPASDSCKQGLSGANGGEFAASLGYPLIDSSANVWVPDSSNRRIQEFDSSGNFIAAYGYNVDALGGAGALESCASTASGACQAATQGSGAGQFASAGPTRIAFDSTGNLYAIDPGNNRVQKFNPALSSASTFAASTFAAYTTQAPENVIATQGGARLVFSVNKNVGGAERQILELDPADTSVKDTSLASYGLDDVSGLGVNTATGSLYATTTSSHSPRRILVLAATPLPNPVPAINPVTAKTDTTATFSATVDPKGGFEDPFGVTCKYQYSTDQLNWTDVNEPDCAALNPNGGAQPLSQLVTGLDPNTHYFVRLSVTRAFPLSSPVLTPGVKAFDTDSVPPVVSDLGAVDVADTSARLVATIDPRHSATGYVFQYGTTPALGSQTAPLAIGSGTAPITVSQLVGGLDPDTTYYFRVVATNLIGTTTSAGHTLHTRTDPLPPPDHRAYEQVSPPDKNYSDVDSSFSSHQRGTAIASPDGNAAAFCPTGLFGDPAGQLGDLCSPYLSRRTPSGWQTTSFPRYCTADPVSGGRSYLVAFPSPDFSRFFLKVPEFAGCPAPPLDPAAPLDPNGVVSDFYREDLTADPPSFDLLAPNNTNPGKTGLGGTTYPYVLGSDDFSHVVYHAYGNQTPDSPPQGDFTKIYDWHDGAIDLVGKDPAGNAFTTPTGLPRLSGYAGSNFPLPSSVSTSGERIYFQNPTGNEGACSLSGVCDLYMRENAERPQSPVSGGSCTDPALACTFKVSASECTVGCPASPGGGSFISANPSGDKAFFYSHGKLTDQSAPDDGSLKLYRWDENAAPGHKLVDLTIDNEPADGATANFRHLIGASDDGNTAYFTAKGQLVSGAPTFPTQQEPGAFTGFSGLKLYRWRWNAGSPSLDYLGRYDEVAARSLDINGEQQSRQVTPDGKYLMIATRLALDPAADRDADADIYRWDQAGGWACISCQRPGAPSAGEVDLNEGGTNQTLELKSSEPRITISDDGQRIFFGTPDALVPEDVNGDSGCPFDPAHGVPGTGDGAAYNIHTCNDVYEWRDGTISLISGGTSPQPSWLIDSTPSGNDAFFYTHQRLVGWDTDVSVDIYDARVGGGFPEPPAQPPSCEAEGCRGPATVAPPSTGAGSGVFSGPANPPIARKAHKHKKHHKGHAKRHHRASGHSRRAGR
jgi:hypothetical protein